MENALWKDFKESIATADLPDLGPRPRSSRASMGELDRRLADFFARREFSRNVESLLRCAALLWHDHLDASHTLSQEIHNPEGSFLHGIMHRREPDYANAKYWFRRVGNHACYPKIADALQRLLRDRDDKTLASELMAHNAWDPCAFIDLCEQASDQPASPSRVDTLKEIQGIEFDALLMHLLSQGIQGAPTTR